MLLDGTLGKNVQDFRTYLAPWSGHPRGAPSPGVAKGSGSLHRLCELERRDRSGELAGAGGPVDGRAGGARDRSQAAASRPRSRSPARGPYVQVQALDAQGNVLGTSAAVKA